MTVVTKELQEVRTKADSLGIKYHHRSGATKIQILIDQHLVKAYNTPNEAPIQDPVAPVIVHKLPVQQVVPMTQEHFNRQRAADARRTVGKLVRFRCQNMNPNKKDWPGEILSAGSAKLGTFKKFIPFDGEPYHVPLIIFNVMKDKMCSIFSNSKNARGHNVRTSRLIHEYSIEELPPLTQKELKELKGQQALAAGQGI